MDSGYDTDSSYESDDETNYSDEFPIEEYPRTAADVKSLDYYLSQLDTELDEHDGWNLVQTENSEVILDIIEHFYGLQARHIVDILHPNRELNEAQRLRLFHDNQAIENAYLEDEFNENDDDNDDDN